MSHFPQKCDNCKSCFREGEPARRVGACTLTFWTAVGPYTLMLCARCATDVRAALYALGINITGAVEETSP